MAGIHASEQGLDETVDHGPAEPRADVVADRDVCLETARRPGLLVGCPSDLVIAEQATCRPRIPGDAHEGALGQGVQRAAGPHARGGRDRVGQQGPRTDLLHQGEALGATGEHRLRADIDQGARNTLEAELATGPVGGVEHDDALARQPLGELPRGRQARDAPSDDDDACPGHGLTLSRP